MQVLPVRFDYNSKSPMFRESGRNVFDKTGKIIYRTTTQCFRDDLDWVNLPELLYRHFKDVKKVNVIDYGCSSGEEAFSLIMVMIKKLGNAAKKFFPIKAKDIDKENIGHAKNGAIFVGKKELSSIKKILGDSCNDFFRFYHFNRMIKFDNSVKKHVTFSQSDIMKDVGGIPKENTVLICRNFLSYLEPDDLEILIEKISEKFENTSSLLITGNYDTTFSRIRQLLFEHGFACLEGKDNIYYKLKQTDI